MSVISEHAREAEPKATVFISYSRIDVAFADRLEKALQALDFEVLIDRRNIAKFEDWWERIQELIVRSDCVVFVISPDAVKLSSVCQQEVTFAQSLNKRLAPILWRPVSGSAVPQELARLNWIDFQKDEQFENNIDELARALETDIEWIRRHTQFTEFAQRWEAAGRPGPGGLMLRPPVLTQAEAWLGLRPRNAPMPTDLIQAFIGASRAAFDDEEAASLAREANLLAQVAEAERLSGNVDTAFKLLVLATRRSIRLQRRVKLSLRAPALLARFVANSGLRLTLRGHTGSLNSATFSSSASHVLTASNDRTARLWEMRTGLEIRRLDHEQAVKWASFSRDGRQVVTAAANGLVQLWETANWSRTCVLEGHTEFVTSADFSPDNARLVTASADNTARIWDVKPRLWGARGTDLLALRGHSGTVTSAVFSPDGNRVLTASWDRTARIWDAQNGREIAVLRGHEDSVYSAAFDPQGARLATASADRSVRFWSSDGNQLASLGGHSSAVNHVSFSPAGDRIITVSDDMTARVWDVAGRKEVAVLRGHVRPVNTGFFSAGVIKLPSPGYIVTGSSDGTARIWELPSERQITVLNGHRSAVTSIAYSLDGSQIASGGADNTVRIWDAATGREVRQFFGITAVQRTRIPSHSTPKIVGSVAFSPDGRRIVGVMKSLRTKSTVRIWDRMNGSELIVLPVEATSAKFSSDGNCVLTTLLDGSQQAWEAATGKEVPIDDKNEDNARAPHINAEGTRRIGTSEKNNVGIWDAASGNQIIELHGHRASVNAAIFSPDASRAVSVAADSTARIWDVRLATLPTEELLTEVCARILGGLTRLSREEMSLAGYPDNAPEIDVYAGPNEVGVEELR